MGKLTLFEHLRACADAARSFTNTRVGEVADTVAEALDEIDEVKADKSKYIASTLSASKWAGSDAPYSQVIAVDGLTANQNGTISLAQSATLEQRNATREALLSVTGQSDGKLTITADGDMPEVDIPVIIVLLG